MVKKRPASYLHGRLFLLFYRATALQRGKSFPSCAWRMPLLHRGFSLALAVGNVKNGHLYFLNINRFCNMCIHPCCCVLLLCNFHHLCNAPGDKNAAKQAAHLISCNWLPFYRPCSFASQTFICFADFHIRAFKIIQKN